MDVVIAIPAFNEVATVGRIVTGARRHGRVVVVDDGSTDATGDHARTAGATVVRHAGRCGKGAALATALTTARSWGAARVVTLDADGQHDPDDVPALLAASASAPRAIVIGSRVRDDVDTLAPGRAQAIRVAGFWLNWIAGTPVADTQSGFRVYPTALFDEVSLRGGRFVFETDVIVQALRRGWDVVEVPIHAIARAERPSRFRPVGDGVAIGAYLAVRALGRWSTELGEAAREVAAVFRKPRRTARHARMLEAMHAHAGALGMGAALGVAAAREVGGAALAWWQHPRARRARVAAVATAVSPALLVLAGLVALGIGSTALDRVTRAVYDQRRLSRCEGERVGDASAWRPLVPR